MITRSYWIMYQGRKAGEKLTEGGAQKYVAELIQIKGWKKEDIQIIKQIPVKGS